MTIVSVYVPFTHLYLEILFIEFIHRLSSGLSVLKRDRTKFKVQKGHTLNLTSKEGPQQIVFKRMEEEKLYIVASNELVFVSLLEFTSWGLHTVGSRLFLETLEVKKKKMLKVRTFHKCEASACNSITLR